MGTGHRGAGEEEQREQRKVPMKEKRVDPKHLPAKERLSTETQVQHRLRRRIQVQDQPGHPLQKQGKKSTNEDIGRDS